MNTSRMVEEWARNRDGEFTVFDIAEGLQIDLKKAHNAVARLRQLGLFIAQPMPKLGSPNVFRSYIYDPLIESKPVDLDECEMRWAKLMQDKRFESFAIRRV